MRSAAEDFSAALADVEFVMPRVPVYQNVHGQIATSVEQMRELLVEQLYSPVRWTTCVGSLLDAGAEQFVECGPGNVLAGLVKRISRATPTIGLATADGVAAANAL
jgi:[acyl-carrier-protein] S-malonyltransferase